MSHQDSNRDLLPPHPDLPYLLDGIHDGIYEQSRYYWNRMNSHSDFSFRFFAWCVNNWLRFRRLYQATSSDNFQHLFVRPYRYFHAMVIVGAITELETHRWDWSNRDPVARVVIGYLYRMRNLAAQEWHENLTFRDNEEDYYSEAYMTLDA